MSLVFAMAGLAEAAWAQWLGLLCIGLVVLTVLALVGLVLRSRNVAVVGLALGLIVSIVFVPWEAFRPMESNDPDAHSLMGSFRTLAVWWIVVSVVTVASAVWTFFRGSQFTSRGQ